MIDYDQLSANLLGSAEKHKAKFDIMRKTHSKLNRIKMALYEAENVACVDYDINKVYPLTNTQKMNAAN